MKVLDYAEGRHETELISYVLQKIHDSNSIVGNEDNLKI